MLENASTSVSSAPQAAAKSSSSNLLADTVNLLTAAQVEAAKTFNRKNNQSIAREIQALVGVEVDGSIGPKTCQGIARWQRSKGLVADGKFGPASKAAAGMGASQAAPAQPASAAPVAESGVSAPAQNAASSEPVAQGAAPGADLDGGYHGTATVQKGTAKGESVKALQRYLNHYGCSVGEADGSFGKQTMIGLMYYQYMRNFTSGGKIRVDGVCDAEVWSALRSNRAAVYSLDSAVSFQGGKAVDVPMESIPGGFMVSQAASKFKQLIEKAKTDGQTISVSSSYRAMTKAATSKFLGGSASGQIELYASYKFGTGNLAASPGTSNHQSGLSVDLNNCGSGNTAFYRWMDTNAPKYNIVNDGKNFSQVEHWHWTYKP